MCLDFNTLDAAQIKSEITNLISPSDKSADNWDPIWGRRPKNLDPFVTGVRKHGKLIERTIIKLAHSSAHWDGIQSYRIKIKGKEREIDNIVFNKRLKIILVLESKRDANQVSGPYIDRIKEYIALLPSEAKRIGFSLFTGTAGYKLYFATFNAYGAPKSTFCGQPVIGPSDLSTIFSDCVFLGWQAFEKEKYDFFKANDILMDKGFERRVKDFKNFDELRKSFSESMCEPDEFQNLDQAIESIYNILGAPLLVL